MARPSSRRLPQLVTLFAIATVVPAVALGWLGVQSLRNDQALERQRVETLLDGTASNVVAIVQRELDRIAQRLATAPDTAADTTKPAGTTVRFANGAIDTTSGPPLLYRATAASISLDQPDGPWQEAERLEFVDQNTAGATRLYRDLLRRHEPDVQAGVLIRLARALKRTDHPDEALQTYSQLATLKHTTILGDPTDLMARMARVELLTSLHRDGQAASEAHLLDDDLQRGRWMLDRTTALSYLSNLALERWRTAAARSALIARVRRTDAVLSAWASHHPADDSDHHSSGAIRGENDVLVVWRQDGEHFSAFATSINELFDEWQPLWRTPDVSVAFTDAQGQSIAGTLADADGTTVVRTAAATKLPWDIRVVPTATLADIARAGTLRRRAAIAGLILLALLVPATGYVVLRSVQRELALARQQADFVSAVSHEFRSPLTSLEHLTSLLRSDFQPSDARRRQYYDVLASETDRLRRFVETLLDFGRMSAATMPFHLVEANAGTLARSAVDEFNRHPAAGAHHATISIAGNLAPILADGHALNRALWNLLENAAKYSPDGAPINVRVEASGSQSIAISVVDHGIGIPESERSHVFDQFFRGTSAIGSAVKGTGVGLAVVRHIVGGHGGDVAVRSDVGVGSTFTITLPVAAAPVGPGDRLQTSTERASVP